MTRFVKIGAAGAELPPDAAEWIAVLDNETDLVWSGTVERACNWDDADAKAKKVNVAGGVGRLPTRKELLSIVDDALFKPAINTAFFPNTPTNEWYWTSTPAAPSPGDCAWSVGFYGGNAYWGGRGGSGFVRAVRARQS